MYLKNISPVSPSDVLLYKCMFFSAKQPAQYGRGFWSGARIRHVQALQWISVYGGDTYAIILQLYVVPKLIKHTQ